MKRSGFTMVELLIVIAIISILAAMIGLALNTSLESARIAATKATIEKLKDGQSAVLGSNRESLVQSRARQFAALYDSASPQNVPATCPPSVAEAVVRMHMLRSSLPQRLEDLFGWDGVQGTPDDSPMLSQWLKLTNGVLRPSNHRTESESSELLYLVLSKGPSASYSATILDRLPTHHIADSDNDGMREFVDEWGQPLRFYSTPTRLFRPGGTGIPIDNALYLQTASIMSSMQIPVSPDPFPFDLYSHPLNQDPYDFADRLSVMQSTTGIFASPWRLGTVTCQPITEDWYWTLSTYHEPLILSCGPDEQIGLVEPTGWDALTNSIDVPRRLAEPLGYRDASRIDDVSDNISSGRLR